MIKIKSIIYYCIISLWTIFVGVVFLPSLILDRNNKIFKIISYIWSIGLYYALKIICNLKMEVRGKEYIPKKPFIIAAKHQSALDIIALILLLDSPIFIMRKSLIYVPIMGIYAYKMGMIFIDRKGATKTLRDMITKSKEVIDKADSLLIFPEGTRTKPGQKSKYNTGIAALYDNCNAEVLPVALNTGSFWKKSSITKLPGTFTIEFLPTIKPGLTKQEFMERLEKEIEKASIKLLP